MSLQLPGRTRAAMRISPHGWDDDNDLGFLREIHPALLDVVAGAYGLPLDYLTNPDDNPRANEREDATSTAVRIRRYSDVNIGETTHAHPHTCPADAAVSVPDLARLHTAAHHAIVRNIITTTGVGIVGILIAGAFAAIGVSGLIQGASEPWLFVLVAVAGTLGLWFTTRSIWSTVKSYTRLLRDDSTLFALEVQHRINRYIGDTLNQRLNAGVHPETLRRVLCHAPTIGYHSLAALHPTVPPESQLRAAL